MTRDPQTLPTFYRQESSAKSIIMDHQESAKSICKDHGESSKPMNIDHPESSVSMDHRESSVTMDHQESSETIDRQESSMSDDLESSKSVSTDHQVSTKPMIIDQQELSVTIDHQKPSKSVIIDQLDSSKPVISDHDESTMPTIIDHQESSKSANIKLQEFSKSTSNEHEESSMCITTDELESSKSESLEHFELSKSVCMAKQGSSKTVITNEQESLKSLINELEESSKTITTDQQESSKSMTKNNQISLTSCETISGEGATTKEFPHHHKNHDLFSSLMNDGEDYFSFIKRMIKVKKEKAEVRKSLQTAKAASLGQDSSKSVTIDLKESTKPISKEPLETSKTMTTEQELSKSNNNQLSSTACEIENNEGDATKVLPQHHMNSDEVSPMTKDEMDYVAYKKIVNKRNRERAKIKRDIAREEKRLQKEELDKLGHKTKNDFYQVIASSVKGDKPVGKSVPGTVVNENNSKDGEVMLSNCSKPQAIISTNSITNSKQKNSTSTTAVQGTAQRYISKPPIKNNLTNIQQKCPTPTTRGQGATQTHNYSTDILPKMNQNPKEEIPEVKELEVAIQFETGYRTFTEKDSEVVKACLRSDVVKVATAKLKDRKQPQLRFSGMGINKKGWFVITPADEVTRDWLLDTWEPPYVDGNRLIVSILSEANDFVHTIDIVFKHHQCQNMERLMCILAYQNQDLPVFYWRIVSRQSFQDGVKVCFRIDKISKNTLEDNQWKVWFEMRNLTVHLNPTEKV